MSSYHTLDPIPNLSQRPVVGYLLKTFPKLSETFILNEILELERQGVALHLFSLRSPANETPHPAVALVKSPVTYIPSLLPSATAQATNALVEASLVLLDRTADGPQRLSQAVALFLQRQDPKDVNELLQGIHLAHELQRQNIAHLHVHFANVPTATAEIAQEICGVPFSITAHAKDIYLTPAAELDRRIAKAEFVLTCTEFNRRYLSELSTSDTPIHLAYHGIDLARFTGDAAADQSAPLELLSIGRFCEKKGFADLLQACRQLRDRGVQFHCAIVGYGPLEAQMKAQITEYGLEAMVTLVGKLTQNQVVERYRQADAFVLPCVVTEDGDRDGIPNVLLEAMAMGLPVVSTDISGIGELVQSEENGLLVPQRDPDALTQALMRLAEDDGLRSRLGQAGQRTVRQRFTLSQNVGEVKAHLLRALQANAPSAGWVSEFSAAIAASVNQQSVQEITP